MSEERTHFRGPNDFMMNRLVVIFGRYAFRYSTEAQLHVAIAEVLTSEGIPFEREVVDGDNRYDFLCGMVAIEVKMARSSSEAHRQVDRYCQSERVGGVVLVTTKAWTQTPVTYGEVRGKPVALIRIRGQSF